MDSDSDIVDIKLSDTQKSKQFDVNAEFLGIVKLTGRFREMADFQFHFDEKHKISRLARSIRDMNFQEIDSCLKAPLFTKTPKSNDSLLPIPAYFSRDRVPFNYRYKQCNHVKLVSRSDDNGFNRLNRLENVSKKYSKLEFHSIGLADETPRDEFALCDTDLLITASPHHSQILNQLRQMFAKRAIWTRAYILNEFELKYHDIVKNLLGKLAYYFTQGPWRMCWVRLGYDPRTDPSARQYQLLDIRFKDMKSGSVREAIDTLNTQTRMKLGLEAKTSRQQPSWIQVCDIEDPSFKKLASHPQIAHCSQFHQKNGWFTHNHLSALRAMLNSLLRSIVKRPGVFETQVLPWLMNQDQRQEFEFKYFEAARRPDIPKQHLLSSSSSSSELNNKTAEIKRNVDKKINTLIEDLHINEIENSIRNGARDEISSDEVDETWDIADDISDYEVFEDLMD